MYTLKNMIALFSEHAKIAEKSQKELIEDFKKNYPGESLPVTLQDDFNFPSALRSICEEILKLKKKK